jgi:hypothetical protein
MANIFKLAKSIRRKHPKMDWQDAIQKAKKPARKKSKKAKNRQTGTSSRPADQRRHARRPGKRKSKGGSTYYERRKNRSDVPGQLTGISAAALTGALKKRLKVKEEKLVVLKYRAIGKRLKKKYQTKITETKSALARLG